jgi:hypothetical protein
MAVKTSTFLISAIKVTVASLVTVIEWLHVDAFLPEKLLFPLSWFISTRSLG